MPRDGNKPIGGFKILYEYANSLANDGFDITFLYPAYIRRINSHFITELARKFKAVYRYCKLRISRKYSCKTWFPLCPNIKEIYMWTLPSNVDNGGIYIATAATTAPYLNRYKSLYVEKHYFIQHFEDWAGATREDILETYRYDMNLITISSWLHNIISSVGRHSYIVPNGFNLKNFRILTPIEERKDNIILMLYHPDRWKGCDIALKAIDLCISTNQFLKVIMFGAQIPPKDILNRVEFHFRPEKDQLVQLYNKASIFVGASLKEGWGLTIGEAMLCGCAVACTDNDGYLEMAKHGKNALVSKVNDVTGLANNINTLVTDKELRYRLSRQAAKDMQRFDIEKSYAVFKEAIGV